MSAITFFVTCALIASATAQATTIKTDDPSVVKFTNSTDSVGVNRLSATKVGGSAGEDGIYVVRSTLPPCTARAPFLTTEAIITIVPIEGKVTLGKVDINGTTMSTIGPDSVMIREPNVLAINYNAECTPATYIAFYTSAKYVTVPVSYLLPSFPGFVLNATYSDQADLLYPSLANSNSQWVVNQECLRKCGLPLPAAVQAAG